MALYLINTRTASHCVRNTFSALRLSAQLSAPSKATSTNTNLIRKSERAAVRWLDLNCHLNAIANRRSNQS